MLCKEKLNPTYKLSTFILSSIFLLTACSSAKPTAKELALINNPHPHTQAKIDALIPVALEWYDNVEKMLYAKGRVLSEAEKRQAIQLGVKNPDKIRVVILEKFPEPNNQTENNHIEGARAMGNIILIKPRHKDNSVILCHELVHTAQIDRLGLKQFLKRYALEREILGYSRSLLENEAYARQQVIE